MRIEKGKPSRNQLRGSTKVYYWAVVVGEADSREWAREEEGGREREREREGERRRKEEKEAN
jgi:hypothetical protein